MLLLMMTLMTVVWLAAHVLHLQLKILWACYIVTSALQSFTFLWCALAAFAHETYQQSHVIRYPVLRALFQSRKDPSLLKVPSPSLRIALGDLESWSSSRRIGAAWNMACIEYPVFCYLFRFRHSLSLVDRASATCPGSRWEKVVTFLVFSKTSLLCTIS